MGDPLSARYLEQFRWFLSAWHDNLNAIKSINDNLDGIRSVTDVDKGTLIREHARLKEIYAKKTGRLNERLAITRKKVKILEKIIYVPDMPSSEPAKTSPNLTLIKPN